MTAVSSPEPILSPESAIAALANADNQIRYYAAWWLGKHQVQQSCEALCAALQDHHYRTTAGGYPLRRQAARALGQLKNSQAVPDLIKALSCQEDIRLREAVIQALAMINDRRAVQPLVQLLASTDEQPYEALIEALGKFQVWEVRFQVEPFLHHSSERVQCATAQYLYLLTQESCYLERIVSNLNHENMYLRWAAMFDLGAIGHLQAAQAILEAKVANSLKLLNLKRLLEGLLEGQELEKAAQDETVQQLLTAIDHLLIQL